MCEQLSGACRSSGTDAAAKEALEPTVSAWRASALSAARRTFTRNSKPRLRNSSAPKIRFFIPSCFDANGGLFETLLTEKDAVISDELNHASIIDGIRLCKPQRFRYKHNDMADLEAQLRAAKDARFRLIATDGCFSMDGTIAESRSSRARGKVQRADNDGRRARNRIYR